MRMVAVMVMARSRARSLMCMDWTVTTAVVDVLLKMQPAKL